MCLAQCKHMLGGGDCCNRRGVWRQWSHPLQQQQQQQRQRQLQQRERDKLYTTTVRQNGYSARVGARHFFKYFFDCVNF